MTTSNRTHRSTTKTRTIARMALVSAAFAGLSFGIATAPAGAAASREVPPTTIVDVCTLVPGSCLTPVIPPVTIPTDTVDPTLPPPVVVDPGDPVDPPCIDDCGTTVTPPCDTEGGTVCPGDPDPGHPDPQQPPVVKVDPPVVAHPTFTG